MKTIKKRSRMADKISEGKFDLFILTQVSFDKEPSKEEMEMFKEQEDLSEEE